MSQKLWLPGKGESQRIARKDGSTRKTRLLAFKGLSALTATQADLVYLEVCNRPRNFNPMIHQAYRLDSSQLDALEAQVRQEHERVKNGFLHKFRRCGNRDATSYFRSWLFGREMELYFEKRVVREIFQNAIRIEHIGNDLEDRHSPKADYEVLLPGGPVRVEIQVGTGDKKADIKLSKIDEARRQWGEGKDTVLIHVDMVDLFAVVVRRIDMVDNVRLEKRVNYEGRLVYNLMTAGLPFWWVNCGPVCSYCDLPRIDGNMA